MYTSSPGKTFSSEGMIPDTAPRFPTPHASTLTLDMTLSMFLSEKTPSNMPSSVSGSFIRLCMRYILILARRRSPGSRALIHIALSCGLMSSHACLPPTSAYSLASCRFLATVSNLRLSCHHHCLWPSSLSLHFHHPLCASFHHEVSGLGREN